MILIGSALMGCEYSSWSSVQCGHETERMKVDVDASTSTSRIYGYTVLIGIGTGSYLLAGIAVVQARVPASEVNNAMGLMTLGKSHSPFQFPQRVSTSLNSLLPQHRCWGQSSFSPLLAPCTKILAPQNSHRSFPPLPVKTSSNSPPGGTVLSPSPWRWMCGIKWLSKSRWRSGTVS